MEESSCTSGKILLAIHRRMPSGSVLTGDICSCIPVFLKERKSTVNTWTYRHSVLLWVMDAITCYEKNPVLDRNDLPEGSSIYDFRDPKMWQKKDGTYACVVGNRPADGSGQILLFESPDGFDWKFASVLSANEKPIWQNVGMPGFL